VEFLKENLKKYRKENKFVLLIENQKLTAIVMEMVPEIQMSMVSLLLIEK